MSMESRWQSLIDELLASESPGVPEFVEIVYQWIGRNEKAIGSDVIKRWRLSVFRHVDLSAYGEEWLARVELARAILLRVRPSSADQVGMLLSDVLWEALSTCTGRPCPFCRLQGELCYAVSRTRMDVIAVCSACSHSEDLHGSAIPAERSWPADPSEVATKRKRSTVI